MLADDQCIGAAADGTAVTEKLKLNNWWTQLQ